MAKSQNNSLANGIYRANSATQHRNLVDNGITFGAVTHRLRC